MSWLRSVTTLPLVPNVPSSEPSALYRARRKISGGCIADGFTGDDDLAVALHGDGVDAVIRRAHIRQHLATGAKGWIKRSIREESHHREVISRGARRWRHVRQAGLAVTLKHHGKGHVIAVNEILKDGSTGESGIKIASGKEPAGFEGLDGLQNCRCTANFTMTIGGALHECAPLVRTRRRRSP